MKVDFNKTVLSSFEESREFKFNNSPQLFKILSDNLYSDKIGSIVREISSNCVDAHTLNNKSKIPFEIYVPKYNMFDKSKLNIIFRDFGPGLSEEEMYNIYTTYCLSTKDNSNDFIGAFGIGSKSPFAYTQVFSVTSINGGFKTLYSIFINSEGFPSISKLSSINTEEKTGLIVSIPVNLKDISEFNNAIGKQLKRFDPLPIIKSHYGEDVSRQYFNYVFDYDKVLDTEEYTFGILKRFTKSRENVIIISGLEYSIPESVYLKAGIPIKDFHYMELKANIGDVDLSASRESLALTDKTINYIKNKIKDIYTKLLTDIFKIENKWKCCIAVFKLISGYYFEHNFRYFNELLKYTELVDLEKKFDFYELTFNMIKFERATEIQLVYFNNKKAENTKYYSDKDVGKRKYIEKITPQENLKIVSFSKIQKGKFTDLDESIFVYPTSRIKTEDDLNRFKENIKKLSEFLENDVIDGDEKYKVQLKEKEKSVERKKRLVNYFRYFDIKDVQHLSSGSSLNSSILEVEPFIGDESIDDLLKDNTAILALYDSKSRQIKYFSEKPISINLINTLKMTIKRNPDNTIFNKRVVCITKTELDRFRNKTSINLDSYFIDNIISEFITNIKKENDYLMRLYFSNNGHRKYAYLNILSCLENAIDLKKTDNINLLLKYFDYNKFYSKYNKFIHYTRDSFVGLYSEYGESNELDILLKDIDKKYPLLAIFDTAFNYSKVSEIELKKLKLYLTCGGYND